MATVIFSARANLSLVLIARCLIALLGIWGILGTDEAFGEVPGTDPVLGMLWRLPLTHSWVGLGAERAQPCGERIPLWMGHLHQAAAPGKFSPGQGGSLNFGAPGCAEQLEEAASTLCKWHCQRITHG